MTDLKALAQNAAHQMMGTTGSAFDKCEGAIQVFQTNLAMAGFEIVSANELKRLRAATQWQPIETADPSVGMKADLWVVSGIYKWRVCDAMYRVPFDNDWENPKPEWCEYRQDPDALHDEDWFKINAEPTHWTTLPTPPEAV